METERGPGSSRDVTLNMYMQADISRGGGKPWIVFFVIEHRPRITRLNVYKVSLMKPVMNFREWKLTNGKQFDAIRRAPNRGVRDRVSSAE